MLRPLLAHKTPTAVELKQQCYKFYQTTTDPMRSSLQRLLNTTFESRLRDLASVGHRGQLEEATVLATIYGLQFTIISVVSTSDLTRMFTETVTSRRKDGRRIAHPRVMGRCLVYCAVNTHYCVGVPII